MAYVVGLQRGQKPTRKSIAEALPRRKAAVEKSVLSFCPLDCMERAEQFLRRHRLCYKFYRVMKIVYICMCMCIKPLANDVALFPIADVLLLHVESRPTWYTYMYTCVMVAFVCNTTDSQRHNSFHLANSIRDDYSIQINQQNEKAPATPATWSPCLLDGIARLFRRHQEPSMYCPGISLSRDRRYSTSVVSGWLQWNTTSFGL